jgi:putative DNA primase/helicase
VTVASDRLAVARQQLQLGIGTLPAKYQGKRVIVDWTEYQDRLPTDTELTGWFGNGEVRNLWVLCGRISRLLILDLDNQTALGWWRTHLSTYDLDLDTLPYVQTSRGRHYWFRTPAGVEVPHWTNKRDDERHFEVRGDGLGTICPPSTHATGYEYEWIGGGPTDAPEIDLDQLGAFAKPTPDADLATSPRTTTDDPQPPHRMIERQAAKVASATEPGRNHALNDAALHLGHYTPHLLSEGDVTTALVGAAKVNGLWDDDGERAVLATIRSGLRAGMREPRQKPNPNEHLTDLGNGRRLVNQHGRDLRFVPPWRDWLVWSNRGWTRDATLEVHRRAKATALAIYAETAEPGLDADQRKAIFNWAKQSESEFRVKAMLAMAQSEPGIAIQIEQLDQDPWLFSTQLGVIERDGTLRPHNRDDLITKLSPVVYDPDARCPRWLAFLDHAMDGDQEMVSFLQRAVGYSMTGITSEKCLFVIHGPTDTGKTVFVETVRALMGEYGHAMKDDALLMSKRGYGGNNDDIADLRGVRFASLSETPDGARLNSALVKQLTGGGVMRAMRKYEHAFEFTPTTTFWIDTNHRPHVSADDDAMWNRVRLIPFGVVVSKDQIDRHLPQRLHDELPGILNWALAGRAEWVASGLNPPQKVMAATEEYRESEDTLARFLADECQHAPGHVEGAATLLQAYRAYSNDKRITPGIFKEQMEARGYEWKRTKSRRGFEGIEWTGSGGL